jgi:hypothetical protein
MEWRMKLSDLDKVNHLVTTLAETERLIATAREADPTLFQLFLEAPGDASLRMSSEGASTVHANGVGVSTEFLAKLKALAVAELQARRTRVIEALGALGVDTAGTEAVTFEPP